MVQMQNTFKRLSSTDIPALHDFTHDFYQHDLKTFSESTLSRLRFAGRCR